MTRQPGPTWYDLLGVAPDAPAAEVRAVWKAAIADLDPTDRRFASLNEAAGVLLDPAQRAAYDAGLAAQAADAPRPTPAGRADVAGQRTAQEPAAPAASGRRVPGWLLGAVALLAAVAVGVTGWLWAQRLADEQEVEATEAARVAAEQAAVPVLSYGFRTLEEDQAAARSYLTDDYREQYDQLFEVIRDNAPRTRTTVQADVVRSGVVRSGEDRVQVLLFVNQTRTNAQTEKDGEQPTVFKNWATVTMQRVDGDWLIDDMTSTPADG